jgi:DNA-binding HxlR family transcriptional regulator
MKWNDVSDMPCSVARSLSVLGDRWTLLILRNAFMRMRRFDDFQTSLGMTRHLLASRLKRLVEEGIFERVPYQHLPVRHEYVLTDKGKALHPVLMALANWGDDWMDEGMGPPLLYQHRTCGHVMRPVMVCSECHEPLTARQVKALPGPGLAAAVNDVAQVPSPLVDKPIRRKAKVREAATSTKV